MGQRPLKSFTAAERQRMVGRDWALPQARNASEPYWFDGVDGPPVPYGTKVSIWYMAPHLAPETGSWWVPATSSPTLWREPCVYRIRGASPVAVKRTTGAMMDADTSIDELELPIRVINCLRNESMRTVGDIVRKSEAELLRIPNFGRTSLNDLKKVLSGGGFFLREATVWENLSVPGRIHAALVRSAVGNRRSLHDEVIAVLTAAVDAQPEPLDVAARLARLEKALFPAGVEMAT